MIHLYQLFSFLARYSHDTSQLMSPNSHRPLETLTELLLRLSPVFFPDLIPLTSPVATHLSLPLNSTKGSLECWLSLNSFLSLSWVLSLSPVLALAQFDDLQLTSSLQQRLGYDIL